MATKPKNNYVSYEIKKLETYLKQLQGYLDKNPPDSAIDRVEHMTSPRGMPILKVIASKEDQIKMFITALEKIPKILLELNMLRKAVDGVEDKSVRGDQTLPGFMSVEDDEPEVEYVDNKSSKSGKVVFEDDEDDNSEKTAVKSLPPSTTEEPIEVDVEEENSHAPDEVDMSEWEDEDDY